MRRIAMAALVVALVGCDEGTDPVGTTVEDDDVARVTIEPGTVAFASIGDTTRISATAWTDDDTEIPGMTFTWAVSDTMVVRFRANVLEAIGPGTATVYAYATANGTQGTMDVSVSPAPGR